MSELNDTMQSITVEYSSQVQDFVETQLVRQIEILEGRVPSDSEVTKHLVCCLHFDGSKEWKWRGNTILIQEGVTFPAKFLAAIPDKRKARAK